MNKLKEDQLSRGHGNFFGAALFGVPAFFLAVFLLSGEFQTPKILFSAYLAYSALLILSVHFFFFTVNWDLAFSGSRHRKNLAKYLEYGYAILLSVSLLQILYASPRLADYVLPDTENRVLLDGIVTKAKTHLSVDCATKPAKIPDAFCVGLTEIIAADDLQSLIENDDSLRFLRIPIGVADDPELGRVARYSTILSDVEKFRLRKLLRSSENKSAATKFFWLGLLLLPLGIGLRLTKTSLEIFGHLDEPPTPAPKKMPNPLDEFMKDITSYKNSRPNKRGASRRRAKKE